MRPVAGLLVVLALLGGGGCVHPGFFTDGTSVSMGRADRGALRGGRALPASGEGYVVPPLWVERGSLFGTDELVGAIQCAAAKVAARLPGSLLGVGDLSRRGGGSMSFHRSHENGRDADLIFYAVDDQGAPVPPASAMPRYNRHLHSRPPRDAHEAVSPRLFDVPRNWALVAALINDPAIDVEYLFISEPLEDKLIEHARAAGEPEELIQKARLIMRQPGHRTLPHDDHLHLRIRCPESDRFQGCVDEGKTRIRMERWRDPREELAKKKAKRRRIA